MFWLFWQIVGVFVAVWVVAAVMWVVALPFMAIGALIDAHERSEQDKWRRENPPEPE